LTTEQFEEWLDRYGRAWERRDTAAFVSLFHPEGRYFWTPFDEKDGREHIGSAFKNAVSTQQDIRFRHEALSVKDNVGICRWWCSFTRIASEKAVTTDGVFVVALDGAGLCTEFREWWHSKESKGRSPG